MKHPENPETSAKTKEIEAMLKGKIDADKEEKKKIMRELQLKYHPDKCEEEFAKTVFQYVQGAKPWFMQEEERSKK